MGQQLGLITIATVLLMGVINPPVHAENTAPLVYISAVKTGGVVDGELTEFVEIYNQTDQVIDLVGWKLEYAKPAAKITDCSANNWKQQDSSSNVKEQPLSGQLQPLSFSLFELSLTDNTGGSIRLQDGSIIYDLVGYGNTVSMGVCKEAEAAAMPSSKKALKRFRTASVIMQDTNNNIADFTLDNPVVIDNPNEPGGTDVCSNLEGIQSVVPGGYSANNGICEQDQSQPIEKCFGVSISEILPNPAGTDTNNEYIELFNSNSNPADLMGCQLKVGTAIRSLEGLIQPGYTVFRGLTLPNTAGGTVEFITPTTEDIVIYPANLKDDEAWALIDGEWQISNQPSPNAPNTVSVTSTTVTATDTLEPCPTGKYRNPATNRCKNIETESGLKPCDPGQYRNPETNRCKSTSTSLVSHKPCNADQVRNPATNRCKKVESSVLKACAAGQERNPATNRCRKVAGASTTAATSSQTLAQDVAGKQSMSYLVLVLIVSGLVGYGLFEYRDNIGNFFSKLRSGSKK